MAASVVHFGEDFCFRVSVLKSAGYVVAECDSVDGLSRALTWNPDAVVLEEGPRALIYEAISLTRSRSTASLILFRKNIDRFIPDVFDLVIPSLTEPQQWLNDIAALIARTKHLRSVTDAYPKIGNPASGLRQSKKISSRGTRVVHTGTLDIFRSF
jgi:hypothetical protein